MAPYKKFNKVTVSTKKVEPPKKVKIGAEPDAAFNWFPGHMMKAMRDIKAKAGLVDLIIEIRDARVPLVSGNESLTASLKGKSRLILLNKANLASPDMNAKWSEWFVEQGVPFLFVNCLDKSSLKQVVAEAKKIIEKKRQECNPEGISAKEKYKFMVIGLPNTGKSTFINTIANRNASKTADRPGQTQVQLWVKVDDEIDLLDTPGVMPPLIRSDEHKLWLSIINAIPDHIVGEEDPACYLINHLLKKKTPEFLDRYKLTDELNLEEALVGIAKVRGCLKPKGLPDLDRVFKLVLHDFRAGELGKITF